MKSENRNQYLALHLVIFLAGFTFLIYEVSWYRLLSLALGTTITASTIVLASFVAGFGAGAYYWGIAADRTDRPGRLLAMLVGGIGIEKFCLAGRRAADRSGHQTLGRAQICHNLTSPL